MNIYDKMICYGLYKQEPSLSAIDPEQIIEFIKQQKEYVCNLANVVYTDLTTKLKRNP